MIYLVIGTFIYVWKFWISGKNSIKEKWEQYLSENKVNKQYRIFLFSSGEWFWTLFGRFSPKQDWPRLRTKNQLGPKMSGELKMDRTEVFNSQNFNCMQPFEKLNQLCFIHHKTLSVWVGLKYKKVNTSQTVYFWLFLFVWPAEWQQKWK